MLKRIVQERWVEARAIFGFWPAARAGRDDVTLYGDDDRTETLATLHFLRQQTIKPDGSANLSLADYVAPEGDWVRYQLFRSCSFNKSYFTTFYRK